MAQPHSIERDPPTKGHVTTTLTSTQVTKAARYTLMSMSSQSIGRLALRYRHIGFTDVDGSASAGRPLPIAYATAKECRYGPRFAIMDRFSQAFVVAHETFHHALAHIQHGAVLYKREPKRFSFKIFNIACDAIINYACDKLPEPKETGGPNIPYGVKRCQELGIVNWDDICREMRQMTTKHGIELSPVFEMTPNKLTSVQIYHSMMRVIREVADARRQGRRKKGWDDLLASIAELVRVAAADHNTIFVAAPVELGTTDLYDSLADISRTFRSSAEPQDREDTREIPQDDWTALLVQIADLVQIAKDNAAHVFTDEPRRRAAALWNELARVANVFQPKDDKDDEDEPDDEQSIIDDLADELNAHDDLREAIEQAAVQPEDKLIGEARRAEEGLRRMQAGAGKDDALLQVSATSTLTRTPWQHAVRRMMNSALVSKISIDPLRPSRRTVSAMYEATRPGRPSQTTVVSFTPRVRRHIEAKRCVVILDTSGSMFADRKLMETCIREIWTICKRVNTVLTVIFADAGVAEVIEIGEAYQLIHTLVPKGGGGTDFRPALAKAEEFNPDLTIYLTDLCGTFPEKAPRKPVIWAYPPEFQDQPTPFGQRLQLAA